MSPGSKRRRFLGRLAELVGRSVDQDFEEEVRFHLERQIRDLIAHGMEPDEARAEAARMFGNVERIRGDVRRVEGEARMGKGRVEYGRETASDFRYALRQLRRRFGPSAATVAVIALGVGAATTVFSYVHRGFLRPLPFPDDAGLFQVRETEPDPITVAYPTFRHWEENAAHFEALAAFYTSNLEVQRPGEPMHVIGLRIAGDALGVMGTGPALGRGFDETEPGEVEGSAMLSHRFWREAYGGEASVLGQSITINAEPRTIVGVMPPEADLLIDDTRVAVWLPMVERSFMGPGMHFLRVVARAEQGMSREQVAERTAALREPPSEPGAQQHGATARPLREALVGDARGPTLVVAGAVSLLLLITCVNLASLALARAASRMPEFAVRVALGARRNRVGRMLFTETVTLSLIGGILGILGAGVGLEWLSSQTTLPLLLESGRVDVGIVLFGLLVSLLTGVAFGLGAVLTARRAGLADLLRSSGGQAGDARSARRQRRVLVGAEAAISVVLLVGTALLTSSMVRLLQQDPGFRPGQVISVHVPLSTARYDGDEPQVRFFEDLLERVRALPGVQSASLGSHVPLSGNDTNGGFTIYGKEFPEGDRPRGKKRLVGSDYLETMGIPLLAGRALDERDRAGERQGVMISKVFAETYWPGEDPLGKELCFCWGGDSAQVVVGVVGDIRHDGLDEASEGTVYMSHAQNARAQLTLFARTEGDPLHVVDDIRREVAVLDPQQPITDVATLESVLRDSLADRRVLLMVVGFFGVTALILAAFGVYAVTAQSAGRRTNELGLRMALGARGRDVVGLVVRDELVAVALGLVAGIVMALALARFLESMLFEISPVDAGPYVAASLLLLGLAVVAALVPARRAAGLDPVQALRAD